VAVVLDSANGVAVLGSTGSIGTQTLDVMRNCLPDVPVRALTAFGNVELLAQQVREFAPEAVWVPDDATAMKLFALLKKIHPAHKKTQILSGDASLTALAAQTDASIVINALTGRAGLSPTLAAIRAGKHVALANKESLVTAGALLKAAAREHNVRITPIDSEHSAIWQCLTGNDGKRGAPRNPVEKIILTASGGPFRTWPREKIANATAQGALKHPNWDMGAKITIDSATLMNKGLEYIEALHLFDLQPEQVEVVVHPQSIIHSAVQFTDGSVMAQMGLPDMRLPILYALTAPSRVATDFPRLDFIKMGTLTFETPDTERFPCLALAMHAFTMGGTAPTVMNAANEWAVHQYLGGRIKFYDISAIISQALHEYTVTPLRTLDDVAQAEQWTHEFVTRGVK